MSDAGTDAPATVDASSDAGGDAGAAPIVAPDDAWTWVDFPESKCASGTPTGLAVNPHAGATDVLLYLEGGGHCTTAQGCWGPQPAATFLTGYGASEFAKYGPPQFPILDRTNTGNPLRAADMIFVPYCTGDLHAGSTEVDMNVSGTTTPTWFWGAKDLAIFIPRLVATFPDAKRVVLAGVSAGGYATILAYDVVAHAFGTRVDALDDSGPPILAPHASSNPDLAVWGFVPPATCASPCNSEDEVFQAARASQPASRFGFLLYAYDTTIASAYNYPTPQDYTDAIDAFSATLSGDPNAATYIADDHACDPTTHPCHVLENDPTLGASTLPWISQMLDDDPAWVNATQNL